MIPPEASSKIRMNSSPMALRLSSGSMTPANRSKKRSAARTWISSMPCVFWKVSTTCSPSPARMRPVSTKTQVSLEPMALCTRAAATAESTPPDSPQMARPSPTCSRMAATAESMTEVMVQSPAHPHTSCTNRPRRSWPHGVWCTSGWNWTAYRPSSGASKAATGASGDEAVTVAPGGGSVMASK